MASDDLLNEFIYGTANLQLVPGTPAYSLLFDMPTRQRELVSLAQRQLEILEKNAATDPIAARESTYLANLIEGVGNQISGSIERLENSLVAELTEIRWVLAQQGEILMEILNVLKNRRKTEAQELVEQGLKNYINGYYAEAENRFKLAVEYDNTDFQAHMNLGFIALRMNDANKAIEHFRKAAAFVLEIDKDVYRSALLCLARTYASIEQYDAAIITLNQAIETIDIVFFQKKQEEKCRGAIAEIDELDKIIHMVDPSIQQAARLIYHRAIYQALKQQNDACIEDLLKVLTLEPSFFPTILIDTALQTQSIKTALLQICKNESEKARDNIDNVERFIIEINDVIEKYAQSKPIDTNSQYLLEKGKKIFDKTQKILFHAKSMEKMGSYAALKEVNKYVSLLLSIKDYIIDKFALDIKVFHYITQLNNYRSQRYNIENQIKNLEQKVLGKIRNASEIAVLQDKLVSINDMYSSISEEKDLVIKSNNTKYDAFTKFNSGPSWVLVLTWAGIADKESIMDLI